MTFTRFSPVASALVPAGTLVRTSDGTESFTVIADPTNVAFSATLNGYQLAIGTASVMASVQAAVAGSAGNVQAGTISLIAAAIPGVDTVTNTAPILGGLDGESDAALRVRFSAFLNSRVRATTVAIGYAISSVQQGLQYTIQENVTQSGATRPGCFVVTVDNGSGTPPATLLAAISTAIEAVRPLGSTWTVVPPTIVNAVAGMSIATAPAATHATVTAMVTAALTNFIDALPVGTALPWSRLAQVAYDASPAVTNVTGVTLNGGTADLAPGQGGVVKASTITVN